jgi:hypothetical protein
MISPFIPAFGFLYYKPAKARFLGKKPSDQRERVLAMVR